MVITFKNFHGKVVAEVIENSTAEQAEKFAAQWNEKASIEEEIREIDLHNGCIIFLNKKNKSK